MKNFVIFSAVIFFLGCASPKSFEEFNLDLLQSFDEQAIGQEIVSFMKAREEGNIDKIISHYAAGTKIMTGGGEPVILTKDEYLQYLLKKVPDLHKTIFRSYPEIKVLTLDKAEARYTEIVRTQRANYTVKTLLKFVKVNGRWLIKESTYNFSK